MKTTHHQDLDKPWSAITLGCWQLARSGGWGDLCTPKDAEAVVKNALDCGVTAFDTAEGYGDGESEKRLGEALGSKKDEVIIVSKVWPDAALTLEGYQERLDGTLKALNRDYVDVYLIHWPGEHFNTKDKNKKLHDIMQALKYSGKARLIGLSNFRSENLERLGEGLADFSVNEIPYSLLEREYEGKSLDVCLKHSIPYMAYSPTAKGLLARRLEPEELEYPTRRDDQLYQPPLYHRALRVFEVVEAIARETGRKPIEVSLAWVLAQKNILTALVGTRKPEQVAEFAKAYDLSLDQNQMIRLEAVSDAFMDMKDR